jgi:antitoxin ParD1/3/4
VFSDHVILNFNIVARFQHLQKLPIFGNFTEKLNIMGRNTSVSLGEYFEGFVESRISQGRYKNVSEVIRAGLRLLEEEENKVQILKDAIQEGIESGIAINFDHKKHLEALKANKMKNG